MEQPVLFVRVQWWGLSRQGRLSGQVAVWVGWLLVGPVSDCSEEPIVGCESVALDIGVVPACPAGPAVFRLASLAILG